MMSSLKIPWQCTTFESHLAQSLEEVHSALLSFAQGIVGIVGPVITVARL